MTEETFIGIFQNFQLFNPFEQTFFDMEVFQWIPLKINSKKGESKNKRE